MDPRPARPFAAAPPRSACALARSRRDRRDRAARSSGSAATCATSTTRRCTHALAHARAVYCAFVFDREILDALPAPRRPARRVHPRRACASWTRALAARGGGLIVRHARARDAICRARGASSRVEAVYANHDYEPAARDRDAAVAHALAERGIAFHTRKDQVIFERDEVLSQAGKPFSVFTPYRNAWLRALTPSHLEVASDVDAHAARARAAAGGAIAARSRRSRRWASRAPTCARWASCRAWRRRRARSRTFAQRIDDYRGARDFPAVKGPSYLSVHLRFGTVSIRELAAFAHARSLRARRRRRGDLAVRARLARLLRADPLASPARRRDGFKPEYDAPRASRTTGAHFAAWCEGRTGYPIVDAAMRQLNATGYMHNRLRMIAAIVPRQGPARRLALGRALLRRHADRLRPRVEQRRLAVGGLDRLRRAAVLPHLQPGDAVGALRRRTASSSAATCPSSRALDATRDPRAVARAAGDPAGEGRGDRPRLSRRRSSTTPSRARRRWRSSASSAGPRSDERRRAVPRR